MQKPLYTEETNWKDEEYILEVYDSVDFSKLSPVTQVQAVCFTDGGKVILYEHIEGWYGLPGGTIEQGESFEETLRRELLEEISAELISYKPLGYFKIYKKGDSPSDAFYHLRYFARVNLLDETPDPDGKAIKRVIVYLDEANKKLNWGKRGELLIELAKRVLRFS